MGTIRGIITYIYVTFKSGTNTKCFVYTLVHSEREIAILYNTLSLIQYYNRKNRNFKQHFPNTAHLQPQLLKYLIGVS